MTNAEQLYNEIWYSIHSKLYIIGTFVEVSKIGFNGSKDVMSAVYKKMGDDFISSPDFATIRHGYSKLEIASLAESLRSAGSNAISNANSCMRAAVLVFEHSLLDAVAFDYLKVTTLASPNDWKPFVSEKKFTIDDIQNSNYDELLNKAINKALDDIEMKSLTTKIDRLLSLCKPPPNWKPINEYQFDMKRIAELDKKRQDIVHRNSFYSLFDAFDDDKLYIEKTLLYMVLLLNHHYGLMIFPGYYKSKTDQDILPC